MGPPCGSTGKKKTGTISESLMASKEIKYDSSGSRDSGLEP